ncbi:ferritin [Planococcaceae bacterium Storch 2/2-2]|nr:ferritin [Planococcaceae bacterium Storch 2/2-2]
MLSEKLAIALNEQMNREFDSAHAYMAKAAFCEYKNYNGFAAFYLEQAKEERFHGMKIYNYLNDRGVRVSFRDIKAPEANYDSLLDTFKQALDHEKEVTKEYYKLTDLAMDEREHATISFLNWFLDEQVEEEASFDSHIEYLTRIGGDKNALFIYEKELGARQFNDTQDA